MPGGKAVSRQLKVKKRVTGGALSILESAAVAVNTEREYHNRVQGFATWCRHAQVSWTCLEELDAVIVQYMTLEAEEGGLGDEGSKLLAALKHFLPQMNPLKEKVPRSIRAVAGWRKLAPGQQGLPLPKVALGSILGVIMYCFSHNISMIPTADAVGMQIVLALYMSFVMYLRPCECMGLEGRHLVAPIAAAGAQYQMWGVLLGDSGMGLFGKTGISDESVLLDQDPWLHPHLMALKAARGPQECLWQFDRRVLNQMFGICWRLLCLDPLRPRLYSLRHGGASHDLLARVRPALDVQKRGRWSTMDSLKRYSKETRVLTELGKCPVRSVEFGAAVLESLPFYVSFPGRVPPPPVDWSRLGPLR